MKNIFVLLLLFISMRSFSQYEDDSRIVSEYIVMLQPVSPVAALLKDYPSLHVKKCLSKRMNIWLLERNTTVAPDNFLSTLRSNKQIKLAQFNHRVTRRSLVPNDTMFNLQWNLHNTGQSSGTVGADIDAIDAWGINHGNLTANGDTIVIAVIDGTFDITHNDLNFFVNHHEIPNNGIDDDGNGFIDDYYGWSGYDTTGNINAGGGDDHAMHVSGIAGAVTNNHVGIAGVCWGPKLLRVAGATNVESEVVESYDYVIAMRRVYNNTFGTQGAFIVSTNSSFGVDQGHPADFPVWCAMYDSMGALGILSAAATTNNPWNVDVTGDIPTTCPSKWLMSVTNTTRTDHINGRAGVGKINVDIGAPGTTIYSTITNNGYGTMTGTSMASPHIAGTIAALYAAACPALINDYYAYSDSIALMVKQMILDGATRISDLYNQTTSGGRLNLYQAVRNLDEYNCNACSYYDSIFYTQPSCSNTCDGSARISVYGNSVYRYDWNTGQNTSSINGLCPGFYSVTITDTVGGCQRIQNFSLFRPDSIVISSIHLIAADSVSPGNIIVSASEGNYTLLYGLDTSNYQSASTLVVDSNGVYAVFIKSETGCVVQKNVVLSGLEEVAMDNSLLLYPNPANDVLNVSMDISKATETNFSVIDMLGQAVLTETKQIPAGIHTATIDLAGFANGVYFLRLGDGHFSIIRKFVVAK
ncbi:MAG: hypothetical protein JWO06_2070 [Bacteroidota bacterium]|nr:hypothetical protein [Bacteroidota bacterium]